jgi:hypothetical protein
MKRLFNRLYYFVETFFVRGALYQLLAVAMGLIAISTLGGWIVFEFSPQFDDLPKSVWWAFLRLTDTGYLGDDEGALPRTVSTILTVSGAVIFLGALIAVMTNALGRFMNHLAQGRSKIFEREHLLILGWHPRIHAIVEELIHSEERVVNRLGRSHLPAIVILTKEHRPNLVTNLRAKLPPDIRDEGRILSRTGNPLEVESLERVDFTRSSAIILVSQASFDTPRHFSDMSLIKILMSLRAQTDGLEPGELPNVVIDIATPANKLLAESVGWQRTEAIASVEFMSRLLCQSIRQPGISQVYLHLLTDTYGESIFLVEADRVKADKVAGKTIAEIIHTFERAIPIGFMKMAGSVHKKEARLRLMKFDEPLEPYDEIICISPSIRSISESHHPSRSDRLRERLSKIVSSRQLADGGASVERAVRRVLLVGWSHLIRPLLTELSAYQGERFEVTIVSEREASEIETTVKSFNDRLENLDVSAVQSGLNTIEEVRQIRPEDFDNIALLSPTFIEDPLLSDAETVMAFVLIDRHLRECESETDVAFLAELNDEDNQPLLTLNRQADVLITQEIVSHLLSQVAVRRALAWVYEELFTYGGPEISFRPFAEIVDLDTHPEIDFDECQAACVQRGRVAIGYQFSGHRASFESGVHLNPERDVTVAPKATDRLIVIES